MNINDTRTVRWNMPLDPDDRANSLTDAFADLPPGKVLVYAISPAGIVPPSIMADASMLAGRMKGNLVQWPNGKTEAETRTWTFGIEKPAQKEVG